MAKMTKMFSPEKYMRPALAKPEMVARQHDKYEARAQNVRRAAARTAVPAFK
jgi:hypothetical protein